MTESRIFVAEDNPADVFLIREALREHSVHCTLTIAADGEEARDYLVRLTEDGGAECPDLIVLDLNLPKMSGIQVLQLIKANQYCSATPVTVLTSSTSPEDREAVLKLGADRFLLKPVGYDEFLAVGGIIKAMLEQRR